MSKFILLSGWACPKESLEELSNELSKSGEVCLLSIHELSLLDTSSCYGDTTEHLASAYDTENISQYARHLITLLNRINGDCTLVGWSTGGIIALEAVAWCKHVINKLVLISGAARFCSGPDYVFGQPLSVIRAMFRGLGGDAEKVLRGFFTDVSHPFICDNDTIRSKIRAATKIGVNELQNGLNYLRHSDLRNDLWKVYVPTLILHGEEDHIVPWQAGKFLADNIKNSTWILQRGIGHDLPVRHPGIISGYISEFLKFNPLIK